MAPNSFDEASRSDLAIKFCASVITFDIFFSVTLTKEPRNIMKKDIGVALDVKTFRKSTVQTLPFFFLSDWLKS